MLSIRLSVTTALVCLAVPVCAAPLSPMQSSAPLVEISHGQMTPPTDYQLYDHAHYPWAGSLTGPSLARKQAEIARIPGSARVIPAEAYAKTFALTLKDALATTPGVFVQPRYGEEVRLSIRGSGLGRGFHLRGVTLLQDGVPINLADGSGDFQELDPLSARSMDIYKGANGMPYGATLGGVINAVTPTGHTAPDRNMVRIDGGSFGTFRTHAQAARVYGDTDMVAAVTAMTSDGYRAQSAQQKMRFNGNVGQRLNDRAETRFYVTYNALQQEVPGTLTLRQALDTPRMAPATNIINDNARDIYSVRLANKTSVLIGRETLDVGVYGAFKDLFHPIFQVLDQDSQTYGGFVQIAGHDTVAAHRNEHLVRVNVTTGVTDAKQYTNVRGSRGVLTADSDQLAAQYDMYGENRFFVTPQTSLVTGLQYMVAQRDFTNNLNPANNANNNFYALNPRVGMVYDVRKNAQIFGNVSRSSEAPIFSDLVQAPLAGFVPLKMQTAWTAELGTRGTQRDIAWDATLYRAWVDNELLNFTTNPSIPAATFNADRTVHQGVELGLDWDVGTHLSPWIGARDQLVLRQVYNLNDFRFDNDPQYGGHRIAGAPLHEYHAELRYAHDDRWSVAPTVEMATGGYVDHANTLRAPGYAIMGANATYRIQDNVELFADLRNLFDKRYVSNYSAITNATTASTAVFYPGDGRSLYAGLKVRF